MKIKKHIISILLSFVLSVCCFSVSKGQTTEQLTIEDIQAALSILNVEIHKINVNLSADKKYSLVLYQQEYEGRTLIKEENIWGTTSPFKTVERGERKEKILEQVRIISQKNDDGYQLSMLVGDFGMNGYAVKINPAYDNPYGCKTFDAKKDIQVGSKIPLFMIGSFWDSTSKDGSMTAKRFCWDVDKLDPEFSNNAFDLMPHYFVLGLSIREIQ